MSQMANFKFGAETTYNNEIDIDDIGNVCIEAVDDAFQNYYLIIRTSLGVTTVVEYGPLVPDIELLPKTTKIEFKRFGFKEEAISKIISKFLSNRFKQKIESAYIIDYEDALDSGVNIFDYMRNYSETSNY